MQYHFLAFIAVLIFALVHLFAEKLNHFSFIAQSKFLSTGGGIAIAYVFMDLLPKLCKSDTLVREAGFFPSIERHVYIMALLAFLLFYSVDRAPKAMTRFRYSLASYTLFNFLIGYAIDDKYDPEVQPLALFTFAISLHFFVNDYSLRNEDSDVYDGTGKWILIAALFLGWFAGLFISLPAVAVALVTSFIGGGVIMNVIRHELPKENPNDFRAFLFSALTYTIVLLFIG